MINKENLREQLLELSTSKKISLVSEINGYDGSFEDLAVYENDEEFFNNFFSNAMDAVRAICYGDYDYRNSYVRFNGYGNLISLDDFEFENDFENEINDIIEWLEDNYNKIDLGYYGIDLEEETTYKNLEEIQNTI